LAALTAGLLAGLLVSVVQATRVTPLILEAERYEAPAPPHSAHAVDDAAAWVPRDGIERTVFTVVANLLVGVGFALLLAAAFALYGGPVDVRTGVLWGLAGFAAFALAPAFGLPPEPPGLAAADLAGRQAWWIGTAAATAAGLAVIAFASPPLAKALGVVAILVPHLIGAPHPEAAAAGSLPAELAARFVAASLVTSAVFWVVLGGLSGWLYRRLVLGPAS
jgi:cobalt transporter subunit CbtA